MIRNITAPVWGACSRVRPLVARKVNRTGRKFGLAIVVLVMLALSPIVQPSTAHAGREWSLSSNISQTYGKSNWSGPAKLGHSVSKSRRNKKRRANKGARKNSKIYRKKSKVRRKKKNVRVASLNKSYTGPSKKSKSVTGGGVRWVASSSCLSSRLKSIIYQVAAKYGRVTVSSTCRSKKHNRRVGGAKRSQHLTGNAADFRVHGRYGAAYAYLKSVGGVGGYKHYGGGLFHIDTGARRTW